MPIGMPGWPEFAFCTASMASARNTLTASRSRNSVRDGVYALRSSVMFSLREKNQVGGATCAFRRLHIDEEYLPEIADDAVRPCLGQGLLVAIAVVDGNDRTVRRSSCNNVGV